jgi:protein TonB
LEKSRVQAPKIRLPNMVVPPSAQATPTREVDLRRTKIPNAPLDLSGMPQAPMPPRPKSRAELALEKTQLQNLMPRLTLPTSGGGEGTEAAPEVNAPVGVPRSGDLATPGVIALSANPGTPTPVLKLPEANLRARFAAGPYPGSGSPGGMPGGVPGASGGSGGGPGGEGGGAGGLTAPDILVTPAGSVPAGPVVVGVEGGAGAPAPPPAPTPATPPPQAAERKGQEGEAAPKRSSGKSPLERARELLEAVRAGARARRRVDTTYAFIPNLTSQSSTWMLRYAERNPANPGHGSPDRIRANNPSKNRGMTPPQVVKKVDPCYPSHAYTERVDGTAVLYAVIRADGGVEDATLVEGIEPRVDKRAVAALAQSQFEPARKNGRPITVEVLVEIPFRLAPCL